MSEKKQLPNDDLNGYLFSVEILVKGATNGRALEILTHHLNTDGIADYRIIKGINLGRIIEANLNQQKDKLVQPKSGAITDKRTTEPQIPVKKENKSVEAKNATKSSYKPIIKQIEQFKEDRTLVRIALIKGKGVKISIPCRILNYDWNTGNITAYHVDEKKVYSIDLNEIDELTSG